MARSFLTAKAAATVKATAPQISTEQFKDRIAMGMAVGGLNRAGYSRVNTLNELITGPAKLTPEEAEEGVSRWEKNQKFYGKVVNWGNK